MSGDRPAAAANCWPAPCRRRKRRERELGMRPRSRRWKRYSQAGEWQHVSWLLTSRCIGFGGRRGARDKTRTNDTVLFEFLMENRLPGEIQPVAAKHGFYLGKVDGDFLAARGSFFELLCDL